MANDVTDAMIDAALCGWNNVPVGHNFSPYQRLPVTREAWARAILAALAARPEPEGMETTAEAVRLLLDVASAAWVVADDTEVRDEEAATELNSFHALSAALTALDTLSDNQPGYTMEPPAKARWALRDFDRLLAEVASLKARLAEAEEEKGAAVAAEREACAKVVEKWVGCEAIARAIRARGGDNG